MKELTLNEVENVQGGGRAKLVIKVAREVGKAIRDSAAYEATKAIAKKAIDAQNKAAAKFREGKTLTRRGYR